MKIVIEVRPDGSIDSVDVDGRGAYYVRVEDAIEGLIAAIKVERDEGEQRPRES